MRLSPACFNAGVAGQLWQWLTLGLGGTVTYSGFRYHVCVTFLMSLAIWVWVSLRVWFVKVYVTEGPGAGKLRVLMRI